MSIQMQVNLYAEYLNIAHQTGGRVRSVGEVELSNPAVLCKNDIQEAVGVIQLYIKGLQIGTQALLKGDFEKFDAVLGDHNCHLTALFALMTSQAEQLREEANQLLALAKSKQGKINIKPMHSKPPAALIAKGEFSVSMSERIKYLVCAAILRSGTECIENRDGTMTLKTDPTQIQQKLSKKCSPEIVKRLVIPLKEYINQGSIALLQEIAQEILSPEESLCLSGFIQFGKTPRNETFQFPCAFYNMKATVLGLARKGFQFVFVKYDPKRIASHPLLIFAPLDIAQIKRVAADSLKPETPLFIIQAFFNEALSIEDVGDKLETYGVIHFLLASIAVNPQFIDCNKSDYQHNEDIRHLPMARQEEIKYYREEGKRLGLDTDTPAICRVAHTYADSFKGVSTKP